MALVGSSRVMNSPHRRFLPLHSAHQVTYQGRRHPAALDLDNSLVHRAARAVDEVDHAVYAQVCALLLALLPGKGLQQRHGPELELVAVLLRQGAGAADVRWLPNDPVVLAGGNVEGGLEAVLHEGDGQVGDVNANPAAVELLRGGDGRAAAAEGV